jgi:purine-binding chemotaxis protein CheW
MEPVEYNERTCIIVVNVNDRFIGLIVDEVSEVVDISSDNIEEAVSLKAGSKSRYIRAFGKIGEEVVILLNISALLYGEEFEQLAETMNIN